jgi:hypothetical protein
MENGGGNLLDQRLLSLSKLGFLKSSWLRIINWSGFPRNMECFHSNLSGTRFVLKMLNKIGGDWFGIMQMFSGWLLKIEIDLLHGATLEMCYVFFECSFTHRIWSQALVICMLPIQTFNWCDIIRWGVEDLKGKS